MLPASCLYTHTPYIRRTLIPTKTGCTAQYSGPTAVDGWQAARESMGSGISFACAQIDLSVPGHLWARVWQQVSRYAAWPKVHLNAGGGGLPTDDRPVIADLV